MTPLQDFCQKPRSIEELVDAGFATHNVYNAVKRKELVNTKAVDAWGRKMRGKGLFLSTIVKAQYDTITLLTAWTTSA